VKYEEAVTLAQRLADDTGKPHHLGEIRPGVWISSTERLRSGLLAYKVLPRKSTTRS
jgi:hypothetical protein